MANRINKKIWIGGGALLGLLLLSQSSKAANLKNNLKVENGIPRIHSANDKRITIAVPVTIYNYTGLSIDVSDFSLRLFRKNGNTKEIIGISPAVTNLQLPNNTSTDKELYLNIDTTALLSMKKESELTLESVYSILGIQLTSDLVQIKVGDLLPVGKFTDIVSSLFNGLGDAQATSYNPLQRLL